MKKITILFVFFCAISLRCRCNVTDEHEEKCEITLEYESGTDENLKKRFNEEYTDKLNMIKNLVLYKWINPLAWMTNAELRSLCLCFAPHVFPGVNIGPLVKIEAEEKYKYTQYTEHNLKVKGLFGEAPRKFPRFECKFEKGYFTLVTGAKNYGINNKFDAYVSSHELNDEMILRGVGKAIPY